MEIHNLMEDIVLKVVDEVCQEEAKKTGNEFCTSPGCKMDVACFVLNRIPQHYVTSGRGRAHTEKSMHENPQLLVDVVTLIHEGFRRVASVRRPYHDTNLGGAQAQGPGFYFPAIKGRFLNGVTFEPISGLPVYLYADDAAVEMIDMGWQNPFILDPKLEGTFLFLPRPEHSGHKGERRSFEFEIRVDAPAFEPFHHFFKLEMESEEETEAGNRKPEDHKLPDLYLLPK